MSDPDRRPHDPFEPDRGSDPYRQWDAAYVLGALTPAERRAYEEHLATCPTCRSDVAEVAGMPGLLAQLSLEDTAPPVRSAEPLGSEEFTPDPPVELTDPQPNREVLTTGPQPIDRRQRRLTHTLIALAAAFVLLAGVVGVSALRGTIFAEEPSATAPFRLAFSPVAPTEITAVVDVVPGDSGTELNVECQYADEGSGPSPTGHSYSIVVTDRSGHEVEIKTWKVRPAHRMTPSGTSDLPVSKIASVEIKETGSAQVLLRAKLP